LHYIKDQRHEILMELLES